MAVVHVEVFGDDASEIAADLEHLLRAACEPGLAVLDTPGRAVLSCEMHPSEGDVTGIRDLAAAILGSHREAERFLRQPHPMLGKRRPLDVFQDDEDGVETVRRVLGRLLSGAAV